MTLSPPPSLSAGTWPTTLRRALVVDDSLSERRLLRLLLDRWGYATEEAGSVDEALEFCRGTEVDVVLSDWVMPDRSGLDLARGFREIERATYGYFILLTTKSESADVQLGYECGADDFMTKPIDPDALRARLRVADRIVGMQRRLAGQNRDLAEALAEITDLSAALDRDLDEARRLQRSLAPDRTLRLEGGVAATALRASGHVGGDLVGLIPTADAARIGVFALDVSGHGIAAALIAARLAGQLTAPPGERSLSYAPGRGGSGRLRPPEDIAGRIHRHLWRDIERDHFVTACVADCDLASGRIGMALAGHPRPLLLRGDGTLAYLGRGGHPLGLIETPVPDRIEVTLSPGDRLMIHSDGLADAIDADEDGLMRLVARHRDLPAQDFLAALIWDVESQARSLPDDISAVVIDRT